MCEKLTSFKSGQAALMEITVLSGIATLDGPRNLVNFGDAWHILSSASAVTLQVHKLSENKPPFVLRTNASSAAILSGERTWAERRMQPAPNTRPTASSCRGSASPRKSTCRHRNEHDDGSPRCANASPLLEVARKAYNSLLIRKLYCATFVVRTSSGREYVVPILSCRLGCPWHLVRRLRAGCVCSASLGIPSVLHAATFAAG